jgi:uncharacterized protein (UPF0261 family)
MGERTHIAVLCALDTKSEHAAYVDAIIERRGHHPVLIDIGVLGEPRLGASITRREVARAGGADIDALASRQDRGAALAAMSAGAKAIVSKLHRDGMLDGILGLGGGSGTAVATAAMRALPVGVPKVMISTMAATAKVTAYVGTRDIVMINTITDIIGMNPILRSVLTNGAAAICGMVEMGREAGPARNGGGRPTVAITAFGATTPAAMRCHELLTKADCETLVFHANGTGGRAMEELVEQGIIDAVLDLTTTELADELCGGFLSAGPLRLEAAGARGIPQVVLPGAMDMVNFTTPDTVPTRYAHRLLYAHSPNTTLMRTTTEENTVLGRWVGEKLALAKRQAVLILPLGGFSEYDRVGGVFYAPDTDQAFMDEAVTRLGNCGAVVRLDANINEPICAEAAVAHLLDMLRSNGATSRAVTIGAHKDS